MKKALIYDPYIDTLGGGERYVLTFALGLIKNGYQVDLAWPDNKELKEAKNRFGLDFSKININKEAYGICTKSSVLERFFFTGKYDLVFWVSDGSLPFLFSKNNLIHLQTPFKNLGGNPAVNYLKTLFVSKFVYNSIFTKSVHEKHLPKNKSYVLYPPIDVESFTPDKKENIILSVARFDSPSHNKRQDVLIDAFSALSEVVDGYRLVLAGGLKGGEELLAGLKEKAKGLKVEFLPNPDFNKLKKTFSKAKFFWHAAGFEVNESLDPENVEHFGITTVEAMSAGCIPIVIKKGGQKEIITKGTGFLCDNPKEMAGATEGLINDPALQSEMSSEAVKRSKDFSTSSFYEKISQLS